MLEQLLTFLMCFNNTTIYIIECISWTIKYLLLLMHGATMKINNSCVDFTERRALFRDQILTAFATERPTTEQGRQYTFNVIFRHVRSTIHVVEKQ